MTIPKQMLRGPDHGCTNTEQSDATGWTLLNSTLRGACTGGAALLGRGHFIAAFDTAGQERFDAITKGVLTLMCYVSVDTNRSSWSVYFRGAHGVMLSIL